MVNIEEEGERIIKLFSGRGVPVRGRITTRGFPFSREFTLSSLPCSHLNVPNKHIIKRKDHVYQPSLIGSLLLASSLKVGVDRKRRVPYQRLYHSNKRRRRFCII
jgi:hypothetical protein